VRFALLAFLLACTQPRSARCKEVCKREADCVDAVESSTSQKIPFDEKECVAACAVLEADVADNGAKVKNHSDCVNRQRSCAEVVQCP